MAKRRCIGITLKGTRCKVPARSGSSYCQRGGHHGHIKSKAKKRPKKKMTARKVGAWNEPVVRIDSHHGGIVLLLHMARRFSDRAYDDASALINKKLGGSISSRASGGGSEELVASKGRRSWNLSKLLSLALEYNVRFAKRGSTATVLLEVKQGSRLITIPVDLREINNFNA